MLAIFDGDVTLFKAAYGADTLDAAYKNAMRIFDSQSAEIWATKRIVYVAGKDNYRKEIFPNYKLTPSRKDSKDRNPWWFDLKNLLVEKRIAIPADGFEADDLVCRRAYACWKRDQEFTVITIDKDLDAIAGPHLKPPTKFGGEPRHYFMTVEEAKKHYWTQVITGDSVDNICGLPGVGPVRASKVLEGLTDGDKMRDATIAEYKRVMNNHWLHALMFTGSLIHIHRYQNDHFDIGRGTWFDLVKNDMIPTGTPKGYKY